MSRIVCLVAFATALSFQALPAQDSAMVVSPGRSIRVHLRDGGQTQGTVVAIDSARLRLFITGADTVSLARDEVGQIDLYQGMRTSVGKSALTGGLIGAGIGALLGALSASATEGSLVEYSAGEGALAYGATFGVLGAGIGALIGTKHRPAWKEAEWPKVILAPSAARGGGLTIGLSLRL